jgi:hypothetical protein
MYVCRPWLDQTLNQPRFQPCFHPLDHPLNQRLYQPPSTRSRFWDYGSPRRGAMIALPILLYAGIFANSLAHFHQRPAINIHPEHETALRVTPSKSRQDPSRHKSFTVMAAAALLMVSIVGAGCKAWQVNPVVPDRIKPSTDRQWVADMARLPITSLHDGMVTIQNFRHCEYVSESDFVVEYFDKTFPLEQIESVDFVVVPFKKTPAIAHTMLSFGLGGSDYVCVSSEIRKELGEDYSPMLGITNQFELCYIMADERDLIRLRTRYRDADVYVYPTVATPEAAQQLFLNVSRRANELAMKPEFYNTFTNNCTTSIAQHVNELKPNGVPASWRVLLPGFSPRYAYDLKLLDQSLPFEELEARAHINDLAAEHFDDPDFSARIRERLGYSERQAITNSQ